MFDMVIECPIWTNAKVVVQGADGGDLMLKQGGNDGGRQGFAPGMEMNYGVIAVI